MASLRSSAAYRIAFTYAAAFAAAVLVLGIAVYFAADAEFRRQSDESIAKELDVLAGEPVATLTHEIAERQGSRSPSAFEYALFDRSGRHLAGSMDTSRPPVGFSDIEFIDPDEGADPARAKAVDLPDGRRLVVAVDAEAIETIDATILELFGAAFAGVLVIGALGAVMLARYLHARLSVIHQTANAIIAGDTRQRIPVGADGDEFDTTALALNLMLDRFAGLMENLRQVSSDVAHDLRTPLLRLRNQLDQVGRVDGAERRAIELADEMLRLFGAILRIAEVEGGELEEIFAPVDLSALIGDVAESFEPALADSDHEFQWSVEPGIMVHGERELVAQVSANLLDNARVHTPVGTRIDLRLTANRDQACLTVADTGPGVSDADRGQLLRRFFRGEASRTTPGNGLGLSLVAAIANAHGGSVILSDNDPGLSVTINLPRLTG